MAKDAIKDLEDQTALALAALGAVFAQVLAEDDVPPRVLVTLRKKAETLFLHLQHIGAPKAALMFGTFVQALHDRDLMPQEKD